MVLMKTRASTRKSTLLLGRQDDPGEQLPGKKAGLICLRRIDNILHYKSPHLSKQLNLGISVSVKHA